MITIPRGILLFPAAPNAIAIGRAPSTVASVVMRIGLNLATDASNTACSFGTPASLFDWQIQQLIFRSWSPNRSA